MLASLTVRARLGLLAALALVAMTLTAVLGHWALREAGQAAGVVVDRHLPATALVGQLRAGVGNLRRFEKDAFLHTGDPKAPRPNSHSRLRRR